MTRDLTLYSFFERIKQARDESKHDNSHVINNVYSGSACNTIKNHIGKKIYKKESEEANPLLIKELEHVSKLILIYLLRKKENYSYLF